jgi:hypothetical protein
LEVGVKCRREKRRPRVRIGRILKRISRPGKSSAALRKALGGKAFGRKCSGVAEKLEALVGRNGRDVVSSAELDEGGWRWWHRREEVVCSLR